MARRMKLVSEAEYEKLFSTRTNSLPIPRSKATFLESERKATQILDLSTLPDDIKLALYSSVVKNLNEKLSELHTEEKNVHVSNFPKQADNIQVPNTSESPQEINTYDQYLIDAIPETFRPAAQKLIQFLKVAPGLISWNALGQCSFDGLEAEGSNLVDLLSFTLRPNLNVGEPAGAKRFMYVLKVLGVPLSILGLKRRKEIAEVDQVTLRKRRTKVPQPTTPGNWINYEGWHTPK